MAKDTSYSDRAAYYAFVSELEALEARTGLFLTDANADHENVPLAESDVGFWKAMMRSAEMAAGQRAENEGRDINKLLGRVIY